MRSLIHGTCWTAIVVAAGALGLSGSAYAQGHGKGDKGEHPTPAKAERVIEHGKAAQVEQATTHRVVKTTRVRRVAVPRARVLCSDGTWALAGRNACSTHDGLAVRQPTYTTKYKGPTPRASARARERASANSAVGRSIYSNTDPTGAIARCVDGTYWHSTSRTNACTGHGGVARWF